MSDEERDKAIKALKEYQDGIDTEVAHINADAILCNLLRELGYGDVVAEYKKIDKWYA